MTSVNHRSTRLAVALAAAALLMATLGDGPGTARARGGRNLLAAGRRVHPVLGCDGRS